jgi:hypothetical protein
MNARAARSASPHPALYGSHDPRAEEAADGQLGAQQDAGQKEGNGRMQGRQIHSSPNYSTASDAAANWTATRR